MESTRNTKYIPIHFLFFDNATMKWFGKSSKAGKSEPLIIEVRNLGNDEAGDEVDINVNHVGEANQEEVVEVAPSADPSLGIDANIPMARITSGERQMVMPKYLQKYNEELSVNTNEQDDATQNSYVPIAEVNTRSQDLDSHKTPTVISAISLSTIGASIEREVEMAQQMKDDQPPFEIAATKQKTMKKEKVSYFQKIKGGITNTMKNTLPNAVIDGLAGAYDTLHGLNSTKKTEKSLDDVPVTARRYRRDHPDLLLPGNVPNVGFTACFAAIPVWVKFTLVGAVAAASVATVAVQLEDTMLGEEFLDWRDEQFVDWTEEKHLAFIGNSYFYVNDIPRLMERISHYRIKQDSVINPSASLGKLLRAGNGMYELWQNDEALTYKYDTNWAQEMYEQAAEEAEEDEEDEEAGDANANLQVYDYGSCTVFQLLEGYDNDLVYMNYNGAYYYEEGANPCFEDKNYMFYLQDRNLKNPEIFDYVVLNDQTARMTDAEARQDSVEALKYAYAPMIKDARATPLVVDTHAYLIEEEGTNSTGYGYEEGEGIPYMQALIYKGVEEYMRALKSNMPSYLEPRVVPVGMAYLAVWEENVDLWKQLFLNETMPYASPHGSYLFANVLYATVYGHLPKRPTSNQQIMNFFRSARYLPELPEGWQDMGIFPTVEQSDYLRLTARRVVLNGYIPVSFTEAAVKVEEDRIYGYQAEVCESICEEWEQAGSQDQAAEEGGEANEYSNYGGMYNVEWDCECAEEDADYGADYGADADYDADVDEQANRQ